MPYEYIVHDLCAGGRFPINYTIAIQDTYPLTMAFYGDAAPSLGYCALPLPFALLYYVVILTILAH